MLWVWLVIWGSLALAAYLWMRIDEVRKEALMARKAVLTDGASKAGPVIGSSPGA